MSMLPSELQAAAEQYLTRLVDNVERYQVDELLDFDVSDEDVDRVLYLVRSADVTISGKYLIRAMQDAG